jgi:Spy/CpxP family protein refolding chaperone
MKINKFCCLFGFLLSLSALAQSPPSAAPLQNKIYVTQGPGKITIRHEMGEWWKDSTIAKKLQLTDGQITQLDQTFYDHKVKLVDYGAQMEKEDLKLQSLLDADVPNEDQVGTQVDQVLTARGKLEREYTMMNLDLRKELSVEQWRQLKSIRKERDPGDRNFFYKKLPPGGLPSGPGAELLPPPPLPLPEDAF